MKFTGGVVNSVMSQSFNVRRKSESKTLKSITHLYIS